MSNSDGSRTSDGRTTDTRARLLSVALELFVEQGVSATSLQHIADRLGVTKAAIYYHVASKSELVQEVLRPIVDDVESFVEVRTSSATVPPRTLLEDYLDLILRHRDLCLVLARDPSAIAMVASENWVAFWTSRVQELLAGPGASEEARVRAVSAVAGLGRVFLLTDVPEERLRTLAIDVAMETLGAAPGPRTP